MLNEHLCSLVGFTGCFPVESIRLLPAGLLVKLKILIYHQTLCTDSDVLHTFVCWDMFSKLLSVWVWTDKIITFITWVLAIISIIISSTYCWEAEEAFLWKYYLHCFTTYWQHWDKVHNSWRHLSIFWKQLLWGAAAYPNGHWFTIYNHLLSHNQRFTIKASECFKLNVYHLILSEPSFCQGNWRDI